MFHDDLIREEWQQGRLLQTQQVKSWERHGQTVEIKQHQEMEARMIFARFSVLDQGQSRIHIATCDTAEEAKAIVDAHNKLLELYTDLCG